MPADTPPTAPDAMRLPGFWRSERRDDLLSPRAMGQFLVRLVETLDLAGAHLVAPDVGAAAALFAAAARPDLLSSVVVGSGGVAVPLQLTGPLEDWVLAPDLDRYRAIDPSVFVNAALDTIEGHMVPEEIRADYLASYEGDRFVESMRYARRYPDELPELAGLLGTIETPVEIISGRRDRVVPLANADFLSARLPNAHADIVDSGHFVWEEAPAEYARIVGEWAGGAYRTTSRAPAVGAGERRTM